MSYQCAGCSVPLEDALILQCGHNLCLKCAAEQLRHDLYQAFQGGTVRHSCTICGGITEIDGASARQLAKGPAGSETPPRQAGEGQSFTPRNAANSSFQANPSPRGQGNNASTTASRASALFGVTSMCAAHPDQPLQFFCLDCESKCICAECVIHGIHKGHEVLSIKKAYPLLQSKVSSLGVELRDRASELMNLAQGWERKQREMLSFQEQLKNRLQEQFAEIRKTLQLKEFEMKKLMGDGLRDGLNFAENKVNEIKEQLHAIEDAQVQMQRNTNSGVSGGQSAIDALNWYADARLSLNQLLVMDLPFATETSKPKEWLQKFSDNAMVKIKDLHLKAQQLN